MKDGYKIDELIGSNWNTAIQNAMEILNRGRDNKLFYQRDRFFVEDMVMALGMRFTAKGEIIK